MNQATGLLIALLVVGTPAREGAAQSPVPSAAPGVSSVTAVGAIRGIVRAAESPSAIALPYAMIQLVDAGASRSVLTDVTGAYAITGVPAGLHRLRAIYIGHQPSEVEVLVPPGGTVDVDLALIRAPIALPSLTVVARAIDLPDVEPIHLRTALPAWAAGEITLRTLGAGTGMVESGLTGAGGENGGGNDPADPRDALLMRGSTTDLKLVLLDGAPVYTPFHLAGLLPSFDASTIGGAALHVGGAPARYDGGLSYILDLRTRPAARDRLRGGGAIDLMSAQGSLEGPLGSHAGLLVAGRTLHDAGAALWGNGKSPYGYVDGLAHFDAEPAAGQRVGVTAFANDESVFLDLGSTLGLVGPDAASWGNRALSVVYQGSAGGTLLDATAAGSRYRAELPIPASAEQRSAGHPEPTLARGRTDRLRFALDASRTFGGSGNVLRFGAAVDRTEASYGAHRLDAGSETGTDAATTGSVAGGYVDATARASGSVVIRAGVRADRYTSDARTRFAPRVSVLWSLSDVALLTLAAGRYHQYARATDAQVQGAVQDLAAGLPNARSGPGRRLPVATADHVVLSLDQRVKPGVRLGIQGFVKGFSSYAGLERSTSSGVDVRVAAESEDLTGWLGYSLAWFWSEDRRIGASTSEFTGRHLLSAGVTGRLAGPLGMDVRVAFSEGLPYTSIPLSVSESANPTHDNEFRGEVQSGTPALGGGPDDGFLRIDAEIHADLFPVWGGRRFALRPYAKVLNALDRRDGLFWYFSPWRDPSVRPLAELSLLPVIGFEWRF